MATNKQVSYGSQGDEVKELQELLNSNGYKLSVDGIFGRETKKAVTDYQTKNNLTANGIVSDDTWGALTKSATTQTPTSTPITTPVTTPNTTPTTTPTATKKNNAFQYQGYQESDVVKKAQEMLNQQLAQKPGAYQSQWQAQLDDIMKQIQNREKFSYDLNGDALYQQYKDQYMLQGQQAMMDTMGQAAALTGGYGNSYAQSAGQQAYHGYLQQLNDRVPELYQLALSKYQLEGDQLLDQYGMLADREALAYDRYRDQLGDWESETDRLQDRYDSERNYDYGLWADGRDFAYQQGRDEIEDKQWQAQFDEAKRQWEYANGITSGDGGSTGSSTGSGSSSGSDSSGGVKNWDNGDYDTKLVEQAQAFVGADVDGKWGDNSAAAAKEKGFDSLAAVIEAMNKGGGKTELSTNATKFIGTMPKPTTNNVGGYHKFVASQLVKSNLSMDEIDEVLTHYGISDEVLKQVLRENGYSEEKINQIFY